jgi:hypothetical protein
MVNLNDWLNHGSPIVFGWAVIFHDALIDFFIRHWNADDLESLDILIRHDGVGLTPLDPGDNENVWLVFYLGRVLQPQGVVLPDCQRFFTIKPEASLADFSYIPNNFMRVIIRHTHVRTIFMAFIPSSLG